MDPIEDDNLQWDAPLGIGDDEMMDRYNVPAEMRRKLTQTEQYKPRDHRMVFLQVVDYDPGYPVFNRYQRRLREEQLLAQARRQIRQYLNKRKANIDGATQHITKAPDEIGGGSDVERGDG